MNSAPTIQRSTTAPTLDDFTPLQEHQEQTPMTFYGAKEVIYYHEKGLTLTAPKTKLREEFLFEGMHTELEGAEEGDVLVRDVEVWVSSGCFQLYQKTPAQVGVKIPYFRIGLHGLTKRKGVDALLLNITLNDPETVTHAEDIDVLEMVLLPPLFDKEAPQQECIRKIFEALNACAELHPDAYEGEEDVSDRTAPGATGWITADNMDEYVDENGNFVGTILDAEDLGPGAGTVRTRDEVDGTNGVEDHDGKYQRTD